MRTYSFINNFSFQTAMCGIFATNDCCENNCVNNMELSAESDDFPFLYTKEVLWKSLNI